MACQVDVCHFDLYNSIILAMLNDGVSAVADAGKFVDSYVDVSGDSGPEGFIEDINNGLNFKAYEEYVQTIRVVNTKGERVKDVRPLIYGIFGDGTNLDKLGKSTAIPIWITPYWLPPEMRQQRMQLLGFLNNDLGKQVADMFGDKPAAFQEDIVHNLAEQVKREIFKGGMETKAFLWHDPTTKTEIAYVPMLAVINGDQPGINEMLSLKKWACRLCRVSHAGLCVRGRTFPKRKHKADARLQKKMRTALFSDIEVTKTRDSGKGRGIHGAVVCGRSAQAVLACSASC